MAVPLEISTFMKFLQVINNTGQKLEAIVVTYSENVTVGPWKPNPSVTYGHL